MTNTEHPTAAHLARIAKHHADHLAHLQAQAAEHAQQLHDQAAAADNQRTPAVPSAATSGGHDGSGH